MKTTLFIFAFLLSAPSFAGKCVVTARVLNGVDCHWLSTRFEVNDEESCRSLAQSAKDSGFFQIMEEGETLLHTRYKFKDKKVKVKNTLTFDETKSCH